MLGTELDPYVQRIMSVVDKRIIDSDSMYAGNDAHYLGVSASALRAIIHGLEATGSSVPRTVLDFGCGYGRVMRAIRAAFPDARIIGSDLDRTALAHCAQTYGAIPLPADVDAERIDQVEGVDLIWCGSVLTHIDAAEWVALLRYFSRALSPGGTAIVTTHGRRVAWRMAHRPDGAYGLEPKECARVLASYDAIGFGYSNYPSQSGYGISLSAPGWVLSTAATIPGVRVVGFVEAGWDSHQDVLVIAKDSNAVLKNDK